MFMSQDLIPEAIPSQKCRRNMDPFSTIKEIWVFKMQFDLRIIYFILFYIFIGKMAVNLAYSII